ncbi:hypothetical protein V1512DRAFT_249205 [Lipomyces arxii]|uniref:uncharacterized protein n=1 Tax=Lipomyces arxii TaxID=56418 RepID=UPI0034CFFB75
MIMIRSQTNGKIIKGPFFTDYIKVSGGWSVNCCIHDIADATGTSEIFPVFKEFGDLDDGMGIVTFKSGDVVMNVYGNRDIHHGHHSMTEVTGTKEEPDSHMEILGPVLNLQLESFHDWILRDKEPKFNLKDAAKVVSIGHPLMRSLHSNQLAKMKFD